MRRALILVIVSLFALVGFNVYCVSTAHAGVLSRYLQSRSDTQHWADYIYQNQSGRRAISEKTAYTIAKAVILASSNYNIAPGIIIGLIKTESGFDPSARSKSGAVGLMQVVPYWHRKAIAGRSLYNIEADVDIGVTILAQYQEKAKGSLTTALRLYCGYRPKAATLYVAKVMQERAKASRSLMVAQAGSIKTPTLISESVKTSSSLLYSSYEPITYQSEKNLLRVSSKVSQKLAQLSAFTLLKENKRAKPSATDYFQAKVYMEDQQADLSIIPAMQNNKPSGTLFQDYSANTAFQLG